MSNESGRDEVVVTSFPETGLLVQVSNNGGREPLWSPDGKELFYREDDWLVAVRVETTPQLRVAQRERLFEGNFFHYRWHTQYAVDPGGQRFLMIEMPEEDPELIVIRNWFEELRELVPVE